MRRKGAITAMHLSGATSKERMPNTWNRDCDHPRMTAEYGPARRAAVSNDRRARVKLTVVETTLSRILAQGCPSRDASTFPRANTTTLRAASWLKRQVHSDFPPYPRIRINKFTVDRTGDPLRGDYFLSPRKTKLEEKVRDLYEKRSRGVAKDGSERSLGMSRARWNVGEA
ncbi:hypothetical protein KM043_002005 [Ampulex compressa]|nr:hypothetical protein KM043_002005 [Ampulex compressa]